MAAPATTAPDAAALGAAVPAAPVPAAPVPAAVVAARDRVLRKCRSIVNSRPNAISSSAQGMTAAMAFVGSVGRVVPVA
jgi:hypothetical protein